MILDIVDQINALIQHGKEFFLPAVMMVSVLWVVHFMNILSGRRLNVLGIHPRHPLGLLGIFFAPFLHADLEHLVFNSVPLIILINLILSYQPYFFANITLGIMLLSGFGIWLFGRRGCGIGASHMVLGYWGYLLIHAYYYPNVSTIALALICLYYFAGMLTNVVPSAAEEGVSWEGHLMGLLAGLFMGSHWGQMIDFGI